MKKFVGEIKVDESCFSPRRLKGHQPGVDEEHIVNQCLESMKDKGACILKLLLTVVSEQSRKIMTG